MGFVVLFGQFVVATPDFVADLSLHHGHSFFADHDAELHGVLNHGPVLYVHFGLQSVDARRVLALVGRREVYESGAATAEKNSACEEPAEN